MTWGSPSLSSLCSHHHPQQQRGADITPRPCAPCSPKKTLKTEHVEVTTGISANLFRAQPPENLLSVQLPPWHGLKPRCPAHPLPDPGFARLLTECSAAADRPTGAAVSAFFNTRDTPIHAKHNEI